MIINDSLPFIKDYLANINEVIKRGGGSKPLSQLQRTWLSFILLGILVTNSVCWARISRFTANRYTTAASSLMFRKAVILWSALLTASVKHITGVYQINTGSLQLDDTDIIAQNQPQK